MHLSLAVTRVTAVAKCFSTFDVRARLMFDFILRYDEQGALVLQQDQQRAVLGSSLRRQREASCAVEPLCTDP